MKTDAVIFDVDGTLWDSVERVAEAWQECARENGAPWEQLTPDRIRQEFGKTMEAIGRSVFADLQEEDMLRVMNACCDYEVAYLEKHPVRVYDGVKDLFGSLRAKGLTIFIVSNCQAGYIEVMLKTNGLEDYVRDHLCPGDTGLAKAGNIRKICEEYRLRAPVYVGDTRGDEEASAQAGLPFIFASYGFGEADRPAAAIARPADLLHIL